MTAIPRDTDQTVTKILKGGCEGYYELISVYVTEEKIRIVFDDRDGCSVGSVVLPFKDIKSLMKAQSR